MIKRCKQRAARAHKRTAQTHTHTGTTNTAVPAVEPTATDRRDGLITLTHGHTRHIHTCTRTHTRHHSHLEARAHTHTHTNTRRIRAAAIREQTATTAARRCCFDGDCETTEPGARLVLSARCSVWQPQTHTRMNRAQSLCGWCV